MGLPVIYRAEEGVNMAEKRLFVLAGFDGETETRLHGWQKGLYAQGFKGTQTKHIPPHFTLDNFPVDREQQLKRLLTELAEKQHPVSVLFSHIGIFPGGKVLFAAPDCNRELLMLKETFGRSYGWTPHATMLVDTPEEIVRAYPVFEREFEPFDGTVTSLHLYEFFPVRHILSVTLSGTVE